MTEVPGFLLTGRETPAPPGGYIERMGGRTRMQITLRSLLVSTSFIGAGIGCFLAGDSFLKSADEASWQAILAMLHVLASAPLIGAGLLLPFGLRSVRRVSRFLSVPQLRRRL